MLKYRKAGLKDLYTIVEIYNSTIPSRVVTADLEPVSVDDRLEWYYSHRGNRPLWMVENENSEVIGWISFTNFYGRPAYNGTAEVSIYLAEKFRGKGYGKEILDYVIKIAPKYEIRILLGFIFKHNHPSINVFRDKGFEEWGKLPDVALLDDKTADLIIVGKKL